MRPGDKVVVAGPDAPGIFRGFYQVWTPFIYISPDGKEEQDTEGDFFPDWDFSIVDCFGVQYVLNTSDLHPLQ